MHISLGTGLASGPRRRAGPQGSAAGAPELRRAPGLVGTGRIGAALAVDPGDWAGAERLVFAWLKDGALIPGVEAPVHAPAPADDRSALACRVTAHNAAGQTAAQTPAITIAFPPPQLVGPIPDFDYTQLTGPHIVEVSPFFSGSSLSFSISGDGVSIDPATGRVTVDAASLLTGVSILVTATNSGGQAGTAFRLTVSPPLPVATPPVLLAAPTIAGTGRVDEVLAVEPGAWMGDPPPELALQWLCDGAPVAGATEARFTPGAAEDGAPVACRVTARNAAGEASAETDTVVVTRTPPLVIGALADVVLAQGGGAHGLPAAGVFAGAALQFSVTGAAADVDPQTGLVTIPTDTPLAAEIVTVTAANSGGVAGVSFTTRVLAAPQALGAPAPAVFAQGPGVQTVAMQAVFAGADLVFALDAAPAGVTINPGSGLVAIPTETALAGTVTVTAANAVGAASVSFAARVLAAPQALGAPAPVLFAQGPGVQSVSMQAFFTGADLVFALDAAPAGVTINPGSGLVAIPTQTPLAGTITVRAANAVGAASVSLMARVAATTTVFDGPGKLAEVTFLQRNYAPSWTYDAANGYAVFSPGNPSDFTHGAWSLGLGDGRYRALVRINHSGVQAAYARSRPFGINGRMAFDGVNRRGIRVELDRRVDGTTAFEIREYTGKGEGNTLIGTQPVAWQYGVWYWMETEFDGSAVRARLYAEGAPPPDWQAAVSTGALGAGYFGPMGHTFAGSVYPVNQIRRLEYYPLVAPTPAAAGDGDWTLNQITVQQ